MSSINPPKINRKASKKNKKSWRKNVDINEVENFLDDQRLDQRLGLDDLKSKKDEQLFQVDTGEEAELTGNIAELTIVSG